MTVWNDERLKLLKKLWAEGLSAGQISAKPEFEGITRNAIIGKVNRTDLPARLLPTNRMKTPSQRRLDYAAAQVTSIPRPKPVPPPPDPYTAPPENIVVAIEKRRGLADLEQDQCRWPIGDPQEPDFHFCDRHQVSGMPYCEAHCAVAYQPPEAKARKMNPRVMVFPALPRRLREEA